MIEQHPVYGPLTREQFLELVRAPYGRAKERLGNPYDLPGELLTNALLRILVNHKLGSVDDEKTIEIANELAGEAIEAFDRWGFLR